MPVSYERDLDLNLLRVFAVVAEEGSVTRAAARLYVTQPAISVALRKLNAFVGTPVFVRRARGVALTSRGAELHAATRQHLAPLLVAARVAPEFDAATSTATVRFGLVPGSEQVMLPPLLAALRKEAPQMQVVVAPAQFQTVEAQLLTDKIALALCVAGPLPNSIFRKPLSAAALCLLYDPRFQKLSAKPTRRELASVPRVAVSYVGDTQGVIREPKNASPVRVFVPSFSYVADLVDGSPLVGLVPAPLARAVVRQRPHLKSRPAPGPVSKVSLDLLWCRSTDDDPPSKFLRTLVERVVPEIDRA
jgi:LysR family transcriptional activator of mexEF-oprN operon